MEDLTRNASICRAESSAFLAGSERVFPPMTTLGILRRHSTIPFPLDARLCMSWCRGTTAVDGMGWNGAPDGLGAGLAPISALGIAASGSGFWHSLLKMLLNTIYFTINSAFMQAPQLTRESPSVMFRPVARRTNICRQWDYQQRAALGYGSSFHRTVSQYHL
jgi:hypothetical protein